MDTSPGPVPGLDAEMIDLGVQIANEQGMDELKRVMDAFSPLDTPGVPAHARRAARLPRVRRRQVGGAQPGDVGDDVDRDPRPARPARASSPAVHCPTLVIVGVEDEPFRRRVGRRWPRRSRAPSSS